MMTFLHGYYLSWSIKGIRKEYLFGQKWYIKGQGVGSRLLIKLCFLFVNSDS